jgi:chemotaxis signal transduction protein
VGQADETFQTKGAAKNVHFVVFELGGQLYGVDVAEVEAIVEGHAEDGSWFYEGQDVPVQSFARWLHLESPGEGPARVLLSRSGGTLRGFQVETPRDILALPLEDIFPMPVLIRRALGSSPLWGVGRSSRGLLLLVDLAAVR